MQNRRALQRRQLIYYPGVFDWETGDLLGHVANISTMGMMLLSEKPMQEKRRFRIGMVLPEGIEELRQLNFEAESRWCKKDVNPDYYAIGYVIQDLDSRDTEYIAYLIEQYGFRD